MTYEVMTEDLVAALDQLGVQIETLGSIQTGVSAASDQLVQAIIAAAQATQAQVDVLLGDLAALIASTDQTAAAADWTGPDSEQFRAANADLLGVITSTNDRLTDSIGQHLAATAQLSGQLDAATAEFTQATQTSTESTTSLRAALQAEVASYDEAFAGSFSYSG